MRRIRSLLLIFAILLCFVACDLEELFPADNETVPSSQDATPSEDTPVSPPEEEPPLNPSTEPKEDEVSIVGSWHYQIQSQDCYIEFYEDGTGWLHYYQYYGQGMSLNGFINKKLSCWSYSPESKALGITVAGADLGVSGLNNNSSFTYVVSELTIDTLVINTNGANDPSIPAGKTLTRQVP